MAPVIEVIGSLNMDLVTTTPRVPGPGETLTASSFSVGFGGKGANQAVACARLARTHAHAGAGDGLIVRMVGAVGDDQFGRDFVAHLQHEGVSTDAVAVAAAAAAQQHETTGTGTAVILVDTSAAGENRILITPGANGTVMPEHYKIQNEEQQRQQQQQQQHHDADDANANANAVVAVFQLEIPLPTVRECIAAAKQAHRVVIFNPAPAVPLPDEIYADVHHLIVNETEASMLSGIPEAELLGSLDKAADHFMNLGVLVIVITLGSKGVFWRRKKKQQENGILVPGLKVTAVDTTAAGDTFVGAYAVHVARHGHEDVQGAVQFANSAAAKSVQKRGAQASIPFAGEL